VKKIILLGLLAVGLASCAPTDKFHYGQFVYARMETPDGDVTTLGKIVGLNFDMVVVELCDGRLVSGSSIYIIPAAEYVMVCPNVPKL